MFGNLPGVFVGGGVPPFGYRVENRKLLVDQAAAAHVRWIFARFLEIGSATGPLGLPST